MTNETDSKTWVWEAGYMWKGEGFLDSSHNDEEDDFTDILSKEELIASITHVINNLNVGEPFTIKMEYNDSSGCYYEYKETE